MLEAMEAVVPVERGKNGNVVAHLGSYILTQVDNFELAADEKALVFEALESPLSLSALCERVDSPEVAAEVYLSSLVAVDRYRTEARLYLDALAFRLGLPEGLVSQLHLQVDEADRQAVAQAS